MPSKKYKMSVYLSQAELEEIAGSAAKCNLSLSTFAKRLCMGYLPESKTDAQAVLDLLKVNADLGRLGGLLKLWLSEPDRNVFAVRGLLHEIEAAKNVLVKKISAI